MPRASKQSDEKHPPLASWNEGAENGIEDNDEPLFECEELYQSKAAPLVQAFQKCVDNYKSASGPHAEDRKQAILEEAVQLKEYMDKLNALFDDEVDNKYQLQIKR